MGEPIISRHVRLQHSFPERRNPNPAEGSESRYQKLDWDTLCAHTTHLILFSLEVKATGRVAALDRLPPQAELAAARTAAQRHGTKLLLCFGGNGRSDGFAAMVRCTPTLLLCFGGNGREHGFAAMVRCTPTLICCVRIG